MNTFSLGIPASKASAFAAAVDAAELTHAEQRDAEELRLLKAGRTIAKQAARKLSGERQIAGSISIRSSSKDGHALTVSVWETGRRSRPTG